MIVMTVAVAGVIVMVVMVVTVIGGGDGGGGDGGRRASSGGEVGGGWVGGGGSKVPCGAVQFVVAFLVVYVIVRGITLLSSRSTCSHPKKT